MADGGGGRFYVPEDADSEDALEFTQREEGRYYTSGQDEESDEEEDEYVVPQVDRHESIHYALVPPDERRAQREFFGDRKVWNVREPGGLRKRYSPVLHGALIGVERRKLRDRERSHRDNYSEAVLKRFSYAVKTRYNPMYDVHILERQVDQIDDYVDRLRRKIGGRREALTVDELLTVLAKCFKRLRDRVNNRWKIGSAPSFAKTVRAAYELVNCEWENPMRYLHELSRYMTFLNFTVEHWKKQVPGFFLPPKLPFYEESSELMWEIPDNVALRDRPRVDSPLSYIDSTRTPPPGSRTPQPSRSKSDFVLHTSELARRKSSSFSVDTSGLSRSKGATASAPACLSRSESLHEHLSKLTINED